jgi:outer membrane biosynthesis protein TonB
MTPGPENPTTFSRKAIVLCLLAALLCALAWQVSSSAARPGGPGKKAKAAACARKSPAKGRGKKTGRCKDRRRAKGLQITVTSTGAPDKRTEATPSVEGSADSHPPKHGQPPADPAPVEEPTQPTPEEPSPPTQEEPSSTPPEEPDPPAEEPPIEEPTTEGPTTEGSEPPPSEEPPEEAVSPEATPDPAPFRFFSPTSFWNSELPAIAPLDPESGVIAKAFVDEIKAELAAHEGPGISTTSYGIPIYQVGGDQPTVRVKLVSAKPALALQTAWEQVPIPPDAQPSAGTDGTLVVWQPSTDRLWEFWRLRKGTEGWEASWGGAMQNTSANQGVYGPDAWPEAKTWWGSSASSLSIAGGLISFEDLQRGRIDHALALAIPQIRSGVFARPAQRTDGKSSSPVALPAGAHLRLDPSLDLSSLAMPPLTRMIAEAAQKYGIFVRDGSRVTHFFGQDPITLASNPYTGPSGYFEGHYPGELLGYFPWDHLQLLKMELIQVP